MIDISSLENKTDNAEQQQYIEEQGIPAEETLPAEEFVNKIVRPIQELQQTTVRRIRMGSTILDPVDGIVDMPTEGTTVGVLTTANTTQIVSTDGTVILPIAVTSVNTGQDTGEMATVKLYRRGVSSWDEISGATFVVATTEIQSPSYTNLDISEFLLTGDQEIRVVATGQESNQSGFKTFNSIVKTELKVQFANNFETPINATSQGATMTLSYYIYGSGVQKKLHVKVGGKLRNGNAGERTLEYTFAANKTYTVSPYSDIVLDDGNSQDVLVLTHGVHKIEAWLTCEDASGNEFESDHVYNQLMVIANSSDTTPYLMLQNVKTNAVNYEQLTLLSYAVYNPSGSTDIAICLKNYGATQEYLRVENTVVSGEGHDLVSTIEVEDMSSALFYVYLYVYRYVGSTEYNFMQESVGDERMTITVDNSADFSPAAGADFYLNPKTRNNSEANPATIVNAVTGQVLPGSDLFTNFGFINDGWMQDEDGVKILRVTAGKYVRIPYEPWQDFINTPSSSMTLEFDIKIKNVTNESLPIIKCYNENAVTGNIKGLLMRPLDGYVMTASAVTEADQNFGWMENERVHISINVLHALRTSPTSSNTISLVRVFVNNNINREFKFRLESGEFINSGGHGGIIIGQEDADIDIYSIRCYRRALSVNDIEKNYVSTLRTSAMKLAYRAKNDIMQDGLVNYAKAKAKYNIMVWHGIAPDITSQGKKTGWLEISKLNADGTVDKDHSGTICQGTSSLPCKGQGSTAKTYYYWNQQYDIKDIPSDALITDPQTGDEVQDGWIDGNGVYRGVEYVLSDDAPKMKKAVLKINYASSMQSHKQGATRLYNDLHTAIVGKNTMQLASPKARVCVYEEAFLYFVQTPNDSEPVFVGLGTFGSGKMDEPTWGYNKSVHTDFMMLEGSDNNKPLTDMRVPWEESKVTWKGKKEYYEYAGFGNIDLDKAGSTWKDSDVEAGRCGPDDVGGLKPGVLQYPKAAWNFLFMHNPMIRPYINQSGSGSYHNFIEEVGLDTDSQYWMTDSDSDADIYELFRYDVVDAKWVHAGLPSNVTTDHYEVKNLRTLYPSALSGVSAGDWDGLNAAFKAAMVADAKTNIGSYFKVDSLKFHYAFVNHFIAGTDNCSKNTYYVLDPSTHLFELHQDDLDTIFKTDNSGYQVKPYYVDRMHPYDDDGVLAYTEGSNNVLFNLIELMYEGTGELANMLNTILQTMGSFVTSAEVAAGIPGNAEGCLQKYMFSIQEYFPDCAYNETARLRYEYPESLNFVSSRGVHPIAQSLGSQLPSERQYMRRRLVYMSSYAAYGEFDKNGNNDFGFETHMLLDGVTRPTVILDVTPHQYLYPTGKIGETLINPHVRVAPGQTYHFVLDNSGGLGDTACALKGANYYRSFGDLGALSTNPAKQFTISGERLTEIVATATDDANSQFRMTTLSLVAPLVKTINLKGANGIRGSLDCTALTRLRSIDVRANSSVSSSGPRIDKVLLPSSELLTSVQLGKYIESLTVADVPNLATLTLGNYAYLQTLSINCQSSAFDSLSFAQAVYAAAPSGLVSVSFLGVSWGGSGNNAPAPAMVMWFANRQSCVLTGVINSQGSAGTYSFVEKKVLAEKFGNIDSAFNPLYLTYRIVGITDLGIYGEKYISEDNCTGSVGDYTYDGLYVQPLAGLANDVKIVGNRLDMAWSCTVPSRYATVNADTGVFHITEFTDQYQNYQVQVVVTKMDGTTKTVTRVIGFYRRIPKLGDFAYLDGTFDDVYDITKDLAGVVYARIWYKDDPRVVTTNNPPITKYVKEGSEYKIDPTAQWMKLFIVAKEHIVQSYNYEGTIVTPINTSSDSNAWGLYKDDTSGANGFSSAELTDMLSLINAKYGANYMDVNFDLLQMTNRGTLGLYVNKSSNTTSSYAYADYIQAAMSDDEDFEYGGFNKKNVLGAPGTTATHVMQDWDGRKNTDDMVDMANKIIIGWLQEDPNVGGKGFAVNPPTTLAELAKYMYEDLYINLAGSDSDQTKYYQFAFPVAYICKLYDPAASATRTPVVDAQYAKGMWYCPAMGELVRLFHHFNISRNSPLTSVNTADNTQVPSKDYANYDEGHEGIDAWNPIFAKVFKRLDEANVPNTAFANITTSIYRSSSELSSLHAWLQYFYTGGCWFNKYYRTRVRAVTAYLFNIH